MTSRYVAMRRDILRVAAAAGVVAGMPALAVGEPPPETRRIRLVRFPFDARDRLRGTKEGLP